MKEWNWERNSKLGLYPDKLTYGSEKRVWWICSENHEWEAVIYSRSQGANCPYCNKERHSSNPEIKIYYYIKKYFYNSIWTYKSKELGAMELDIYIPELSIGIEYDGSGWHQDIQRDLKKDKLCHELNIRLIRIREPKCPIYQSTCEFIYLPDKTQDTLKTTINNLLQSLGIKNADIDFNRDFENIENLITYKKDDKISFADECPDAALEWHPTKNGKLRPDNVTPYSNRKVWWKCSKCGNEWMAVCSDRMLGRGCPKCAWKKQEKMVFCLELNKIFSSIRDACSEILISHSSIIESCRNCKKSAGKHPITKEKLHWFYVKDQRKKDGTFINGAITLGYITQQQLDNYLNN